MGLPQAAKAVGEAGLSTAVKQDQQVVDKLISQCQQGTIPVETIPVESISVEAANRADGSISKVGLSEQLYVVSFALVNLVLARLVIGAGSFAALSPELVPYWALLSTLLGSLSLIYVFPDLVSSALAQIKQFEISFEVLRALILGLLFVAAVYAMVFDHNFFEQQLLVDSLALVAAILIFDSWMWQKLKSFANANSGFALAKMTSSVKRLDPYPNHNSVETLVAPQQVKVGDLYRISAGQVVPCDGLVVEGQGDLLERRYSGATKPKIKYKGHRVFAGSVLKRGEILCEATSLFDDAYITSFTDQLDKVLGQDSSIKLNTKIWESRICIVLLVAALTLATYSYGTGQGFSRSLTAGASILCLCFLVRIPWYFAFLAQLEVSRAFHYGVLLAKSSVLELIHKAKSLVFDYSGSFISERFFVKKFEIFDERLDRDGLISVISCLLGSSDVQRDEAIVEYLRTLKNNPEILKLTDFRSYEGRGISAAISGVDFSFGTEAFLVERGVYLQASEVVAAANSNEQVLYLALAEDPVACFVIEKRMLNDRQEFVGKIRAKGLHLSLCSAEQTDKLDELGRALGLDLVQVHSAVVPERYIEKIAVNRPTLFLQNSKTDPTISKEADLRLSFFDELRWNLDQADVLILREDLEAVPQVVALASAYVFRQNLIFCFICLALIVATISVAMVGFSPGAVALSLLAGTVLAGGVLFMGQGRSLN